MRGYLKSFLLFSVLYATCPAFAAGAGDACSATNKCTAGLYCDATTNKCAQCPTSHPNSAAGATGRNECYKTCAPTDITVNGVKLGTKTPGGNANYNTECTYTVACDAAVATKSGDTCTGRCFTITLDKNLTNFLESDKHLYVKYADGFYKTSGCTGAKLDPNSASGWITPSTTWWQDFTGYSTDKNGGTYRFGSDGRPATGTTDTTFTANTTLYGQWNKREYTIEYYIYGTSAPDKTDTCYYGDGAPSDYKCTALATNATTAGNEVTRWSTGQNDTGTKYEFGDTIQRTSDTIRLYAVWDKCSAGYYCTASQRQPCPAGATSVAGASQQTQCYISGATNFRDKNGTFQLPIGNINYQ